MNFNIRDDINLNNDLKALFPNKEEEARQEIKNKDEK